MNKLPLAIPALLFMGGIVAGAHGQPPVFTALACCAAAFLLAALTRSILALAALLFFCGWTSLVVHTAPLGADLRNILGDTPRIAAIRGTLVDAPATRLVRKGETLQPRSHCMVEVAELKLRAWQSARGRVVVWVPEGALESWLPGALVEVSGVLAEPAAALAPGLFDYRKHLAWKGVYYVLSADSPKDFRLLSDDQAGLWPRARRGFVQWTQRALSRGFPEDDKTVRLLWAMTLGWTTALTEEVSEPLVRTGTLHVFAISGMHVALITAVIALGLRVLRVPRGASAILAGAFLWFYTFATGFQPSAVRSAIMATVVLQGWGLKRPSNLLNSLLAAALLILLLDPRALFHPGFQLSFFVVLALALLTPPLIELHDRWIHPDPLLAEEVRAPSHRLAWRAERAFALLLAGTIAAWIGSLPISAYYFNVLSPIALLSNLIVVPLSNGALISCFLSLLASPLSGWLSEVFNNAAHAFMNSMLWFADATAWWRGSAFHVARPSLWAVSLLYLVAGATALKAWRRPRTALVLSALCALCLAVLAAKAARHRGTLTLTALPGDGAGTFLQSGGETALIDCGNAYAAERVLKPFLKGQGVNRLGAIILTHGDAQHIGGLKLVAERFSPRRFVTSDASFRSRVYRDSVAFAEGQIAAPSKARFLETESFGRVLHPPPAARARRADDAALVLRVERYGRSILLLGDLGLAGQQELLGRDGNLRADVLVMSRSSEARLLLDDLLARVQPKAVVFSGSRFGSRGPEKKLEAQLVRAQARFYNTEATGAVTVHIFPSGKIQLIPIRGEPLTL